MRGGAMKRADGGDPSLPRPVEMGMGVADFVLYADESGKLTSSDYTSLCGYLTHSSEWERLNLEWNNCRFAWDVPPIHMAYIAVPERDKSGEWQKIKTNWGSVWERKCAD